MNKAKITDFLPEVFEKIDEQLRADYERYGDTWKKRPVKGQEERAFNRYRDYIDQFRNAGVPIPWTKVIGEAIICMVREAHPEVLVEEELSL